jgi:hypothetical protein
VAPLLEKLRTLLESALTEAHGGSNAASGRVEPWSELRLAFEEEVRSGRPIALNEIDSVIAAFRDQVAALPAALQDAILSWEIRNLKYPGDGTPPPPGSEAVSLAAASEGFARHLRFLEAKRHNVDRCDCLLRIQFGEYTRLDATGLRLVMATSGESVRYSCETCGTAWERDDGYDDLGSWTVWSPVL